MKSLIYESASAVARRPTPKGAAGPWWPPTLIIAGLWIGAQLKFGWSLFTLLCAIAAVPVVLAAWTDLRCSRLPLHETLPAIGLVATGLLAMAVVDPTAAARALLAAAAAFVVLGVIGGLTRVFAFGDVLLALPLTMLLAYQGWVYLGRAVVLVPLVALPAAVIAVCRKRHRGATGPLGPWLVTAAVIALMTV